MKIEVNNQMQVSQEGFWRDVANHGIFTAIMRSILSRLKVAEKTAKLLITNDINDEVLNKFGFSSRATAEMVDFKKFMDICKTLSNINEALINSMQNFDKFNGTMLVESFKGAGYRVEKGKVKLNKPNLSKTEKISKISQNISLLYPTVSIILNTVVLVSFVTGKIIPMSKLGWTAKNINLAMRKFIELLNDFKDVSKYDKVLKNAVRKDMSDDEKQVVVEKVKLLKSAINLYKEEMRNLCVFVCSIGVLTNKKENKKENKKTDDKEVKEIKTEKEEPAKEEKPEVKEEPKKEETK